MNSSRFIERHLASIVLRNPDLIIFNSNNKQEWTYEIWFPCLEEWEITKRSASNTKLLVYLLVGFFSTTWFTRVIWIQLPYLYFRHQRDMWLLLFDKQFKHVSVTILARHVSSIQAKLSYEHDKSQYQKVVMNFLKCFWFNSWFMCVYIYILVSWLSLWPLQQPFDKVIAPKHATLNSFSKLFQYKTVQIQSQKIKIKIKRKQKKSRIAFANA